MSPVKVVRESDAPLEAARPSETGRADAFRRLAESHIDDSYRLAAAVLGSGTDARDVVHDAFITAWHKWPSLRDSTRFGPWFKQIVVNKCRDRQRRSARLIAIDASARPESTVPDASEAIHRRMHLEESLASLRPDDQLILALRYYRDLPIKEIAEMLDIPSGTATSRLRAAHTRLREAMDHRPSKGGLE